MQRRSKSLSTQSVDGHSACWNEKYQPLTIDKTKDKYGGR